MNSPVSFVKTKMAGRHWTQPVTDVPISALPDSRDLPITTVMLCEVYPDAELNESPLHLHHHFPDGCLNHVWGAQTTRYHVGNYYTTPSFPDVPPLMSPASSTSSSIFSGAEATSATWPSPSPAPSPWPSVGRRDPGRRDTGRREETPGRRGPLRG